MWGGNLIECCPVFRILLSMLDDEGRQTTAKNARC